MTRTRALLATLRIANAPSVVSNVWLGYFLGSILVSPLGQTGETFSWRIPGLPILSGLLLYFAGNLANDWFDREWDKSRRPERALPSGLFQPPTYLGAAIALAIVGLAAAFLAAIPCGIAALGILLLVALYTWIHKRTAWSVVPMGLCRAGLYVLGFTSRWHAWNGDPFSSGPGLQETLLFGTVVATLAAGLFAYIAGLSMSARYEGMPDPPPGPKWIARSLLLLPLVAMPCWLMPFIPAYAWIGMLPYAAWLTLCLTRYRRPVPAHVSALLAGIPLVDAIFLLPASVQTHLNSYGAGNFAVLVAGIPLAAFILGRLLQKVAPAT